MKTAALKKKISNSVQNADAELLMRIVEVIDIYHTNATTPTTLNEAQLSELDRRRSLYLSGKDTSLSWEEVQHELKNTHGMSS